MQEDEDGPEASPTQSRLTLWENWGARQGWVKAIKKAKTVGTLALGFLTLVETAYLFGIGKVYIMLSEVLVSSLRVLCLVCDTLFIGMRKNIPEVCNGRCNGDGYPAVVNLLGALCISW